MRKNNEIAVGVKLYIGEYPVRGAMPGNLEKYVTVGIEGVDIGVGNELDCKFYDDITGHIYFHFKYPILKKVLELYFSEDEIIKALPGFENTLIEEEEITVGEYDSLFGDINYDSLM